MAKLLWITGAGIVLIVTAFVLPDAVWSSIGGLPAHPLVVHSVIVLIPVLAIAGVIGVFLRGFLRVTHAYVLAGLGLASAATVAAKKSGEALSSIVGLPVQHSQWGTILVPLVISLFVAFALFCLVAVYRPVAVLRVILGVAVTLLAAANIVMTVLVGHSGAESVWTKIIAGSSVAPTTQGPTPSPTPSVSPSGEPSASPSASAAGSGITLAEVSGHNTPSDCWAVVGDGVYDLSSFASLHPGGAPPIEGLCGIDATERFAAQHGGQARPEQELAQLYLGPVSR